jgi:hypothetical protein
MPPPEKKIGAFGGRGVATLVTGLGAVVVGAAVVGGVVVGGVVVGGVVVGAVVVDGAAVVGAEGRRLRDAAVCSSRAGTIAEALRVWIRRDWLRWSLPALAAPPRAVAVVTARRIDGARRSRGGRGGA